MSRPEALYPDVIAQEPRLLESDLGLEEFELTSLLDLMAYGNPADLTPAGEGVLTDRDAQTEAVHTMLQAKIPSQEVLSPSEAARFTERIKRGEQGAIGEFLLRRLSSIYGTAQGYAEGDPDLTEDLFQDFCVKVLWDIASRAAKPSPKLSLGDEALSLAHAEARSALGRYKTVPFSSLS